MTNRRRPDIVIVARLLAAVPFLGMLGGVTLANRVTPLVFGLPFVLAWIVGWVMLTAAILAIIFAIDPANRGSETESPPGKSP